MSRLRDESGFTLAELLISMVIFTIILGGTLLVLESFQRQTADERVRYDSRDMARTAVDRLAKPLRTAVQTSAGMVELNGGDDLVYQSVGPTPPGATDANTTGLQRVRICLDPSSGKIWRYTQAFTGAAPALPAQSCDGTQGSYTSVQLVTAGVSNGVSRPLFTYDYKNGGSTPADVQGIQVNLDVDANGSQRLPGETQLSTAIALRNVARAPTASFTCALISGRAVCDASSSFDPSGQPLTYSWSVGDNGATPVASGVAVRFTKTGLLTGHSYQFILTVTNAANLSDTAPTQTLTP